MADFAASSFHDPVYALAASPNFADDGLCFAARGSGLFRSTDFGQTWQDVYGSLALQAPLTTTCAAFSPDYAADHTLFAGAPGGVLHSTDGGEGWTVAGLPPPPPFLTGLVVSPHFREDGLVFAATMEDGVLRSWDRGRSWAAWNFGLLDLSIFALAISPRFADDETLFAGAESGVFCSTNGGRAWRETAFPMEMAPVLSLAIAPDFAAGGSILAGTEAHGLWRSHDMGESWQPFSSQPGSDAVNMLILDPDLPALLALVGATPYVSHDGGGAWGQIDLAEGATVTCAVAPSGLRIGAPLLLGTREGHILTAKVP